MVAIALESRASIATIAGPLTSSFLPKCSHLLQARVTHRPPIRLSFHDVAASTKEKKKGRNSSSARDWSYEHLMVLWDEVFEKCCTDSVKATTIRDLSYRGLSKHGRGCVLVFQEVQTRPRGSGTGFTSKPPKSSRSVPDFVTLDWYAVYLPREFLLDPRKAPNEAETAPQDDETSSADSAQVLGTCKESNDVAARVVDRHHEDVTVDVEAIIRSAQDVYQFGSDDDDDDDDDDKLDVHADDVNLNKDSLLILDDKEDASAASTTDFSLNPNKQDNVVEENTEMDASSLKWSTTNENASMGDQGMQEQSDGQSEDDVELATQQMLFTTMRGLDRTRLMSLTSNFDFEAKTFRFGRKMAMIDTKTMDAGGEDPYNPNEDELVLLLHLVTDGRPAFGADVVIAYKDDTQSIGHEKDVWKLKGKYKI